MDATTIDDQLAGLRRRIGRLQALTEMAISEERSRIQRHVDALNDEEASLLAAAPDEFEAKLAQLRTRLAVAENSVFADLANDWETFAAGVERELRGWHTYFEQLQVSVFDAQIADVQMRLVDVYASRGDRWQEQRERLTIARDELRETAAALATRLDRTVDRVAA